MWSYQNYVSDDWWCSAIILKATLNDNLLFFHYPSTLFGPISSDLNKNKVWQKQKNTSAETLRFAN